MPIHFTPISRRRFLVKSALAGAGLLSLRDIWAADAEADPHHFVLFSDTHIEADPSTTKGVVNMAAHLRQAVGEVMDLKSRPAAVFVNGDCAFLTGEAKDYETFTDLLRPLTAARFPIHATLGNHDHRQNFWDAAVGRSREAHPLQSKHVSILKTERANFFLLDSLDRTNVTKGVLGREQIDWLGKSLDANPDKPAIVFGHHHPLFTAPENSGGLTDTGELFAVLQPRKQVKAYIFGHTHHWDLKEKDGIHLLNLPAVAYPFNAKDPTGWVDFHLAADGATFELRSTDPKHPAHGEKRELKWREA
jgi:3',5'-cyclic AMP phosphodiesterase CpdA